MIVKAKVVDKISGKLTEEYFLVRFDHTPITQVTKRKRRTGICSIYYLSDKKELVDACGKKIEGQFFASRICGEKYKYFLVDQSISCAAQDNYCKAYARIVTLQKALNWLLSEQKNEDFLKTLPFAITNETFKTFISTLHKQHPHGKATAMELIKNRNYRISNVSNEDFEEEYDEEQLKNFTKKLFKAVAEGL